MASPRDSIDKSRFQTWRTPGLQRHPASLWHWAAWLVAALVSLPILAVFYVALNPTENIWPHLWETVLPRYIQTTLWLLLGVGLTSLIFGVGSAWLVSMYRFPGRRWYEWALLLPFAMPAYVIGYLYTDLLEYSGWLQASLRSWFGWETARDYWFPSIRSLGGAVLMLSLVLYPYIYMTARAAFLEQSEVLLMAGRSLGCSPWQSFWRISLPIARPAIAVGLSLVLLETINDFGTVDYFAVQTLTRGLYDTWLNMGNIGGAAQIACCTLVFVVALITLEKRSRARQKHFQGRDRLKSLRRIDLRGWRKYAASGFCGLLVLFGFLLPFGMLCLYALQQLQHATDFSFVSAAGNSFLLSALAALATILLGLLLAYARRLHPSSGLQKASALASLGYAMPGAVLAIGVLVPFGAFDNSLDAWMRQHMNLSTGLLLSGSAFAIFFAYLVRFLAVSTGTLQSSLDQITPSMDLAARSLGAHPGRVLIRIHLPLLRRGILTAALVVFVDCLKELPATLMLRPFNFDTLATYVYQFASDELIRQCAPAALLIVAIGIVPVVVLNRSISQGLDALQPSP